MHGGDPIGAFWRGEITLRRLRVLVEHLPPGGAYYRAVQGHGWVEEHYLLADLIDAENGTATAVYRGAAGKGKRVPNPRRYPRPGQDSYGKAVGDRGGRSIDEVKSYLDSLKPPPAQQKEA